MTESKAAGPKTELVGVSVRMQQSIENMIESMSRGVGDCVEFARTAAPKNPYDRQPSSEREDAATMVTTIAELLSSIAKLKGEFSHNYHVTRADERPAAQEHGWNGDESKLLTRDEYDELNMRQQVDYDRWCNGFPPKFGAWKRPKIDPPSKRDTARAPADEVARRESIASATPSPSEIRGSNGQASES